MIAILVCGVKLAISNKQGLTHLDSRHCEFGMKGGAAGVATIVPSARG